MVEYLSRCFNASLSGESIAMKSFMIINTKLQFLYRKNKFITL